MTADAAAIYDAIRALAPDMWLRNYATCRRWDASLRRMLDAHGAHRIDAHTARVGEATVWVCNGNWPFAYGAPVLSDGWLAPELPSRRTALRLRRELGE